MVRCIECGFLEPSRYVGDARGVCTENMKKPRHIQDVNADIRCKRFVAKRREWSTQDFHEWKDKHITMRRTFLIAVASLIISILVGILSITYSQPQLIYEVEDRRAELSILAEYQWSTNGDFAFRVSGQIRNEGKRATVIENVEIGLLYIEEDGTTWSHSMLINELSIYFGWQDSTLEEEQSKQFSLSLTGVYRVEEGYPDEGWIKIYHHDGIDIQEETRIFFIKRGAPY